MLALAIIRAIANLEGTKAMQEDLVNGMHDVHTIDIAFSQIRKMMQYITIYVHRLVPRLSLAPLLGRVWERGGVHCAQWPHDSTSDIPYAYRILKAHYIPQSMIDCLDNCVCHEWHSNSHHLTWQSISQDSWTKWIHWKWKSDFIQTVHYKTCANGHKIQTHTRKTTQSTSEFAAVATKRLLDCCHCHSWSVV